MWLAMGSGQSVHVRGCRTSADVGVPGGPSPGLPTAADYSFASTSTLGLPRRYKYQLTMPGGTVEGMGASVLDLLSYGQGH